MWQQDGSHYGEKAIHHMWNCAQSRPIHNNSQHKSQLFDVLHVPQFVVPQQIQTYDC
jgi:hypothetical protein